MRKMLMITESETMSLIGSVSSAMKYASLTHTSLSTVHGHEKLDPKILHLAMTPHPQISALAYASVHQRHHCEQW